MTFGWPSMLWALMGLPLLAWGYLLVLRRQRSAQARLADLHLLHHLVRPAPAWRRHLPVAVYLAAVLLLVLAMARPTAAIPLPVNRAAVVIAIDTSLSMLGEDVPPTRLEAAKAIAREFIGSVPASTHIGLVAFSDYGTVLVPPSTDRQALEEALASLRPRQATAVGSAIVEALRVLPGRAAFLGERLQRLRGPQPQPSPGQPVPTPSPPTSGPAGPPPRVEDLPPATILIFSDGVSNLGADPRAAAALAAEAHVRIYTVGMGQQGGTVMQYNGQLVLVPFDPTALQQVAQQTGGEYFHASSREEVRRLSRQVGRAIGWERRRTEVTSLLAGVAGMLMLGGAVLSMLWFRRVP